MTSDHPRTAAEYRKQAKEQEQREAVQRSATNFLVNVAFLPLHAWVLMLVLGAVHSVFAPVAAVGYGTALLFVLGVDLLAVTSKKFRK